MKARLLSAVAISACLMAPVAFAHSTAPNSGAANIQPWGFDLAGRDLSVRAGDDFNRHANGAYLDRTEIPADRARIGAFDDLDIAAQANLRKIIEDAARNPATANARQIGDLYRSYMDEAGIEALGRAPLDQDLTVIRNARDHSEMARLMGLSQSGFHGSLFEVAVFEDMKKSSQYAFYVAQGSLGLPDRDYYLNDEFAEQRTAYRAHVERMLTLAGWDHPAKAAQDIIAFETELARVHWTRAESRDMERQYHPVLISKLGDEAPGFDWPAFMQGLGITADSQAIVNNNTAVTGIAAIFARTPLDTLKAWQAYSTTNRAAPWLSKAFVDAHFDFNDRTMRGQPQMKPRWKRGVSLVDNRLSEAVGEEYVARHFPASSKAQMEELVGNLKTAMRQRLNALDWMGPETRREALAKLESFHPKIGYPDTFRSYADLQVSGTDLYGNVKRSNAFEWAFNRAKIGQPIDLGEWLASPQTVNAYYHPLRNEIVFPAAILQAPFFDPNADAAVNYGGIGAVIGHEIIHGFDDQGRKTDSKGELRDWWTAEDSARFDARAKALGALYSEQEILPGMFINAELTMGENIADLGGLTLALAAYRNSLNGAEPPVIDGFTGEQRLFLAWAQVWRQKMREQAMRERLTTNEHSPGQARAATPPRNLDDWYIAFGITPDQRQYLKPEDRVRIW